MGSGAGGGGGKCRERHAAHSPTARALLMAQGRRVEGLPCLPFARPDPPPTALSLHNCNTRQAGTHAGVFLPCRAPPPPGPGDLRCSERAWKLARLSMPTRIRNHSDIAHRIDSHVQTALRGHSLLTAANPTAYEAISAIPALHPVSHITLPLVAMPQQALVGCHTGQSHHLHASARRHPRFILLAACCEKTLAIYRLHNIFRICPPTDLAHQLHFPDRASLPNPIPIPRRI